MEKNNVEEKTNWLFVIIIWIVAFAIGYDLGSYGKKIKENQSVVITDTTYNHIVLDSISYNIIRLDTTIYNIKEEMKDEIEKALSDNDSVAVRKFTELASAN